VPGSLTRLSALATKTLREDPADAEVASHRLLVRAGFVRRVAPGIYAWLPLGLRTLRHVEAVVREEMEAIGAQEVLLPALVPREPYDASGRSEEYGDLLFRLQDRRGTDYLLAPTHEELFTLVAAGLASSYRDLPLILFQVQTKYRDEARPRGGILRGREFVMKDSYSFDLDEAGLDAAYQAHRGAYQAILERLGVGYRIVSAVSGAMGGSHSEEFLAPASAGEDTFASCAACGCAANTEAVTVAAPPPTDPLARPPLEEVPTRDSPTIESLAAALHVPASATLKCVVVKLDGQPALVLVPGDREADLDRLAEAVAPSSVELFGPEDFATHPGLVKGYVGPMGAATAGYPVYADQRVAPGTEWVTGANQDGVHARHVTAGRDFAVDHALGVATMADGDPCPTCGEPLALARGIEVGHIFQLGRRYSDVFKLDVAGPDGRPVRVTMGSYGIGISRLVAALAEQSTDEAGLSWPVGIGPTDVHVVPAGRGDHAEVAARLATELAGAGLDVLLDDRGVAPGVAFADADLLGAPFQVVVGRGLAQGEVERKVRRTGERGSLQLDGAVAQLLAEVATARPGQAVPGRG